jgi:hypothetical protein
VGPSQDVNPFFEGDLVQDTLSLDVKTDTVAFFGNYGVSRALDIGVAIPIVSVKLDATMTSSLIRLATSANPTIHSFGGSSPNTKVTRESGEKTGLGDILLRAKYNFLESPGGGLAAALDLRLPTGDKEQLLGTGATQTKLSLIYSGDYDRVAPHLNLGYTLSSGRVSGALGTFTLGDEVPVPTQPTASGAYGTVFRGQSPASALSQSDLEVPDELDYTAGLAVSLTPRITLNGDVIGRTLRNVKRFGVVSQSFNFRTLTNGPVQSTTTTDGVDITTESGNLTLLLGAVGVKINVSKTLLVNANVLFPLNSSGLKPKITPVIGIDYAF